jgi:ubiquinone/menaquinone biosynthesis C-methylase UbiE
MRGDFMKDREPSAQQILDLNFSFIKSRALITALDIEVFEHIGDKEIDLAAIAGSVGCPERGVANLLDVLVGIGLVNKSNSSYSLADVTSKYLLKDSPDYVGAFVQMIDEIWDTWGQLTEIVKGGETTIDYEDVIPEDYFDDLVVTLFPLHLPFAKKLVDILELDKVEGDYQVVDVAAGSCVWSLPLAQSSPDVHVTAVDFPKVVKAAQKVVSRHSAQDSYSFLAGDMSDIELPENSYDLAIFGHIFHIVGEELSRMMLGKVVNSLKPGGKAVIAEIIVDDDRTGPLYPLLFGLFMLTDTESGNSYSQADYREWLTDYGFEDIEFIEQEDYSSLVIGTKPR